MLTGHQTLEWWEGEQAKKLGERHPHRLYPKLLTQEREMEEVAGEGDGERQRDVEGIAEQMAGTQRPTMGVACSTCA